MSSFTINQTRSEAHFERYMFRSLIPAIVIVPIWVAVGRTLFGGPGGWNGLVYMYTVCPILFFLHILLLYLCIQENNKQSSASGFTDYSISRPMSIALISYYILLFFNQFVMDDGGDQGPMGSWAVDHLRISRGLSNDLHGVSGAASLALMILMISLSCWGMGQRPTRPTLPLHEGE